MVPTGIFPICSSLSCTGEPTTGLLPDQCQVEGKDHLSSSAGLSIDPWGITFTSKLQINFAASFQSTLLSAHSSHFSIASLCGTVNLNEGQEDLNLKGPFVFSLLRCHLPIH